ncbi:MAG: DnaA regulatory inactivator Hda [Gammaproteobacteria bacterium]|nr:DnaA regulatory inactivator Hda [Gammaproteobacteria bacterium]
MSSQLALGIELKPRVDFNGFISAHNAEAVSRVKLNQDPFIYLWGESGSGKSHLLQAACRQQSDAGQPAAYVPLNELPGLAPEMLDGLESMQLVCLDDLQKPAGDAAWELALFNLFNRLRDRNAHLLVAADRPPARLAIALADLSSRLTWGPCYHLIALDDAGRMELLIRSAEQRGLKLPAELALFLLHRLPRDIHSLIAVVEHLDRASLAAQRRLTIPFVRKVLRL